jgi:hypothetical protein
VDSDTAVAIFGISLIVSILMIIAVFGLYGPVIERWGMPRGFRWIPPVWDALKGGLRWILLRIFYPERLPATGRQEEKLRAPIDRFQRMQVLEDWDHDYCTGRHVWDERSQNWVFDEVDWDDLTDIRPTQFAGSFDSGEQD